MKTKTMALCLVILLSLLSACGGANSPPGSLRTANPVVSDNPAEPDSTDAPDVPDTPKEVEYDWIVEAHDTVEIVNYDGIPYTCTLELSLVKKGGSTAAGAYKGTAHLTQIADGDTYVTNRWQSLIDDGPNGVRMVEYADEISGRIDAFTLQELDGEMTTVTKDQLLTLTTQDFIDQIETNIEYMEENNLNRLPLYQDYLVTAEMIWMWNTHVVHREHLADAKTGKLYADFDYEDDIVQDITATIEIFSDYDVFVHLEPFADNERNYISFKGKLTKQR